MVKKKKCNFLIIVLILVVVTIQITTNNTFAQTFKSANEKFTKKNYSGAEKELIEIIKSTPDNIKARKLLNKIKKIRKQKKSIELAERALLEIDNNNFTNAKAFLEKAIILNPANNKARELYLSIEEVNRIEKKSIIDKKKEEQDIKYAKKKIEQKKMISFKRNKYFLNTGASITFADSNNLNYINSDIIMTGLRFDGRYYFDFLERQLGISGDYNGNLIKITGDNNINFITHRFNATIRFRSFFFEDSYSMLTVGVRLNYHYYYLQNLKDRGVYNFTNIYGPSPGLFISDPIIYRFYKKDFFKFTGFESEINYLYMLGKDTAPTTIEFYTGVYYRLNRYRFALGYRLYWIENDNAREKYNNIELTAGYIF